MGIAEWLGRKKPQGVENFKAPEVPVTKQVTKGGNEVGSYFTPARNERDQNREDAREELTQMLFELASNSRNHETQALLLDIKRILNNMDKGDIVDEQTMLDLRKRLIDLSSQDEMREAA